MKEYYRRELWADQSVYVEVWLVFEDLVMTVTTANAADGRTVGPDPRPGVSAELLDVKAVALVLGGCSTRHVYRLADAGRMPRPIKLGALIRWRRAELEAWIGAGCPSQQPGGRRP